MTFKKTLKVMLMGLGLTVGASAPTFAQQGLDEPFQKPFKKALEGKTVAYVPVAMNFDLTEGWFAVLKKQLEPYGMKVVVRDANWSTNAGAQAVTTLISEKPAVIVVHNPDVQTYAKLLQRAEKEGIYVIQINMGSAYRSTGFVGANWIEIGEKDADGVVKACQGKSNKIAIVQGALSAAASAYTLKGVENVLAQHPEIKVVSSQAADWDAAKAKAITQTVLKQNPDLCGIVGFWDGMDIGTAAAVKEAGLTGKVFVATSGGGERKGACEQVKSGAFDLDLSYDVPTQAAQMAGMIKWLISSDVKAGSVKGSSYTTLIPITKANADNETACWNLGDLKKERSVQRRSGRIARPESVFANCFQPTFRHLMRETLTRWRYRYWPDHLVGAFLSKPWTSTAIPVIVLLIVGFALSRLIDNFLSPSSLADTARQAGEIGFIALGGGLVVIVGGIDLSVGSMFALTDFCALYTLDVLGWPVVAVAAATIVVGALLGAINGFLIGYLRLRAFITTLITLIVYRSAFDLLIQRYSNQIASAFPDFPTWNFIGGGDVFGVPSIAIVYLAVAIFGHIFLTRLRPGWHITAIGGSRRSAYNSGIPVRRTIALCYVACGALTALGALFFAARLGTVGGDIGVGLEVIVLTATVLGGITLGGGKGSVTKSAVGTLIVLLITNGLTTMNARGGFNRMALASILLIAATVDIRWQKNRARIISKVYVSPTFHELPPSPTTEIGKGGPFEQNDKLRDVTLIGLGRIEAPEDVILDRHDNLYAGSRHGDVIRFLAPDYETMEVFAHIGGQPLGMAFDRKDNLYICIGGMGLYRIAPDGAVEKATDETNRSLRSVNDDSRLRLADDLDITDNGLIFFSEATIRYEMDEWPVDGLEGRGNGRIICYDTNTGRTHTAIRGLKFPNGICVAGDGQSILFAETFGCSVKRYWFDGSKKGAIEVVMDNLPGYPDNINLASDGNYWLALVGMRSPSLDLAWKMPGFRTRMAKRVPVDEWLFPNINTGCVVKFNEKGEILDSLWDLKGLNHPMIT